MNINRPTITIVALRKESVDRNEGVIATKVYSPWSLSARRAWIEIRCSCCAVRVLAVALRKESVDRNFNPVQIKIVKMVALRKESVDRNYHVC